MIPTNTAPPASRPDLFIGAALAAALVVLAGFPRSFYLRPLFQHESLPLLVHLHGLVMSSWVALFLTQCWLIAARHVSLHRRLGVFGALLAALVVLVGAATAINAGRLGRLPPSIPPSDFMAAALTERGAFTILIGTGLLGSLELVDAAFARIPFLMHLLGRLAQHPDALLRDGLVLVCIGIDTLRHRRLHPAFALGAGVVFVSDPLADWIAAASWWHTAAAWILG